MSSITDMIIFTSLPEHAAMGRLNAWCAEHDARQQQFQLLDGDQAGGAKVFTCDVWAMAGNYFPHRDLREAFPSFGWIYPESVILIVDDEHSDVSQVQRASDTDQQPSGGETDA
jgi:hypothetical protein